MALTYFKLRSSQLTRFHSNWAAHIYLQSVRLVHTDDKAAETKEDRFVRIIKERAKLEKERAETAKKLNEQTKATYIEEKYKSKSSWL